MPYYSLAQLCADVSYYRWDYLLALRHCFESRAVVSVIAGFGLRLHAGERGSRRIELHEFCGNGDGIDVVVQCHLSVCINRMNFVLFCPESPDCNGLRSALRNPALCEFMAAA